MTERDLAEMLRNNPDLEVNGVYRMVTNIVKSAAAKLSEHDLQVAVIAECDQRAILRPEYGLIFAIPNGGQRTKAQGGKLKAEGVRAGVPDLAIFVARHRFHGAFIELKVGDNKPTDRQRKWHSALKEQGYAVMVFWDEPQPVIDWINWYLEG